jgi:predicted transcriptional regulator of viral defense system
MGTHVPSRHQYIAARPLLIQTAVTYYLMTAKRNIAPALTAMLTNGVLRARDIETRGIRRAQLGRWVDAGALVRIGRGIYALPDRELGEHESIVHAATRVTSGIVCLLSALRIYGLTTQNPPEVWLALPRTARAPRLDWPPLRVVRWSGAALTQGVVQSKLDGVPVRITTAARTVADCFKHRSTVGLDVAIEALRDYRRQHAGTMDELMNAAKVSRVHRVIQPYVEAMT